MLLGIIILIACVYFARKAIQDARSRAWTGPRTPAMRSRAAAPRARTPARGKTAMRSAGAVVLHPSNGAIRAQAKADAHRAWQEVFATDWIEQQRHARANGTAPAGGTATATAAKPTIRQRLRLAPFTPATANGNGQANSGNGSPPKPAAQPPPAPPQPSRPASSNGGTPVSGTSTASAEKLIEGINEIHAHAQSGGIHAKREAVKAIHEGLVRFGAMLTMLSRQMSEPGANYGPEITEPVAQGGQHCQAAAMSASEADAALTTLMNMTVGDLATSPRPAPHHTELSETGAR
jgi:hypothetical protein